jgi:hypothetical protein
MEADVALVTSSASTRPSGQRMSRSYIIGSLPSPWRHTSTSGRQSCTSRWAV